MSFANENETPDCTECPLATRRWFLHDAAIAVAAIAASLGAGCTTAALPVTFTSPRSRSGGRKTYAIPATDGAQIDKDAEMILVRWQNTAYAFNLSCPHQNTALRWDDSEHGFQCPKHHSKYRPDGQYISGRATRNMDRLGIARQGGDVVVDVDTMYRSDEDPKGWAAALVKLV